MRLTVLLLALTLTGAVRTAGAESGPGSLWTPLPTSGAMPSQVFSANPLGLMVEFYNFEYEARANDSLTVGAGASRLGWRPFSADAQKPYLHGDVFVRYYPSGRAFNGVALGLKAGLTQLRESGTFAGLGFDVNHSATLNRHVVLSSGVGLKRLVRRGDQGAA